LPALDRLAKQLGAKRAEAMAAYVAGQLAALQGHNDDAIKLYESELWTAEETGLRRASCRRRRAICCTRSASRPRDTDVQKYRELALASAERIGTRRARARPRVRSVRPISSPAGSRPADQELTTALALAARRRRPTTTTSR